MTDLSDLNVSIMSNRDGMMGDEGRWPGVPPDPQETTLRTSFTNKLLVNEDCHDAATVPRFLGCVPPSDGGGGAFFTILSAVQIFSRDSSFWRYKVCADIRTGFLERRR